MPFVPRASLAWRMYRRLVRTCVQFFAPPDPFPRADILKLCNLPAPFPGVENENCPTVVIDLEQPEESLWNGVESKTKKVIRQAVREGVDVEHVQLSAETWNSFHSAYQKLRSRKKAADPLGVGQIGELIEQAGPCELGVRVAAARALGALPPAPEITEFCCEPLLK